MPSIRARLLDVYVRAVFRRHRWGDDAAGVARRARRLFGVPGPYGRLALRGLRREDVREGAVRGEWIVPPAARPGVVLYVHGGGYVACSAATHRPLTGALARLARRRVLAIDYRLAPEHRYPAALDDVEAAYRWLLDSGVAPESVAIGGDSAGGGLTLALLQRARDAGLPLPACAVLLSPWTDLAGTGASLTANDGRCAMFRPTNIHEFAAAYLGGASAHAAGASPVFGDLAGLPPLLLQVGADELLLDDARRVDDGVRRAGGTSRLEVYDGVFHDWHLLVGLLPEADAAMASAAAFVGAHLAPALTPASAPAPPPA